VHIGFGIGGGIVLTETLQWKFWGIGRIGHISVDMEYGLECDCGNKGCIELYASVNSIIKEVQRKKKKYQSYNE
jgi:Transcriptional regulator/sugar kinase